MGLLSWLFGKKRKPVPVAPMGAHYSLVEHKEYTGFINRGITYDREFAENWLNEEVPYYVSRRVNVAWPLRRSPGTRHTDKP